MITIEKAADQPQDFVPRNKPGVYWVPAIQELWGVKVRGHLSLDVCRLEVRDNRYIIKSSLASIVHCPHERFGGNLAWQVELGIATARYDCLHDALSHLVRARIEPGEYEWLTEYVRMWSDTAHVNAQTAQKQVNRLLAGELKPRVASRISRRTEPK